MRQKQLTQVDPKRISRINFLNRREIAELSNLLVPGEQVLGIVSGFYISGTAILCITSKRLLLIDKKWVRLNFEDARLDSISEVNYSHQAIMASLKVFVAGRELLFKSWYKPELRMVAQFIQHKMAQVKSDEFPALSDQTVLSSTIQSEQPQQVPAQYQASPQMEQYLSERIARWRRANKFIDNLPKSVENQALEQQF